jgi:hypothetical protein
VWPCRRWRNGIRVAGADIQAVQEDLVEDGLVRVEDLRELRTILQPLHAVLMYVPTGAT